MALALLWQGRGRLGRQRRLHYYQSDNRINHRLLAYRRPFHREEPRLARRSRSIGSGRLQEYNHPGAVLGRCEPAIWLHVVAGHNLIGFRDEAIELLLIPYKLRALHGTGIAVVRKGTGFSSDDTVEGWAQAIVAFFGRMAGPACVVECQLPRLGVGVGALARRLLGHSRELQKHQECDAHQSRDYDAGHKASWRLNARS